MGTYQIDDPRHRTCFWINTAIAVIFSNISIYVQQAPWITFYGNFYNILRIALLRARLGDCFFAAAWNFSEKVLKTLKRDMHLNIHNLLGILKKHCHKMIFIYGIWFLFFLLTHQKGYTLIFQILINLFFQLYYHWTTHYRTF